MDFLPCLPPSTSLPPAGLHCSGYRRSASAPSLDAMAEAALRLETTPCSVLDTHSLEDEVSQSLRRTLRETQCGLLAAVQAGVVKRLGDGGSGGGGATSADTRRQHYGSDFSAEGASDGEGDGAVRPRRRSDSADPCSAAAQPHHQQQQQQQQQACARVDGMDAELEADLAVVGLSAREREAALKRAKNRQAARRSRERKAGRISSLQGEVSRLRANNFVLLKCVEEVAGKALAARAEQKALRDKLALLQLDPEPAGARLAVCCDPGACTPPAARRAAALERELLAMEAAPASPTHLLLPHWPEQAAPADMLPAAPATAPAAAVPLSTGGPRPTSAELRRELRQAVAGEGGRGGAAATTHHHLYPSPVGARLPLQHTWQPEQQQQQQVEQQAQAQHAQQQQQRVLAPAVLHSKREAWARAGC